MNSQDLQEISEETSVSINRLRMMLVFSVNLYLEKEEERKICAESTQNIVISPTTTTTTTPTTPPINSTTAANNTTTTIDTSGSNITTNTCTATTNTTSTTTTSSRSTTSAPLPGESSSPPACFQSPYPPSKNGVLHSSSSHVLSLLSHMSLFPSEWVESLTQAATSVIALLPAGVRKSVNPQLLTQFICISDVNAFGITGEIDGVLLGHKLPHAGVLGHGGTSMELLGNRPHVLGLAVIGVGIFTWCSKLNHSCYPSAQCRTINNYHNLNNNTPKRREFEDKVNTNKNQIEATKQKEEHRDSDDGSGSGAGGSGPVMKMVIVKDIKEGEEVEDSYIDLYLDRTSRRRTLLVTKHFICRCLRCREPIDESVDRFLDGICCPRCTQTSSYSRKCIHIGSETSTRNEAKQVDVGESGSGVVSSGHDSCDGSSFDKSHGHCSTGSDGYQDTGCMSMEVDSNKSRYSDSNKNGRDSKKGNNGSSDDDDDSDGDDINSTLTWSSIFGIIGTYLKEGRVKESHCILKIGVVSLKSFLTLNPTLSPLSAESIKDHLSCLESPSVCSRLSQHITNLEHPESVPVLLPPRIDEELYTSEALERVFIERGIPEHLTDGIYRCEKCSLEVSQSAINDISDGLSAAFSGLCDLLNSLNDDDDVCEGAGVESFQTGDKERVPQDDTLGQGQEVLGHAGDLVGDEGRFIKTLNVLSVRKEIGIFMKMVEERGIHPLHVNVYRICQRFIDTTIDLYPFQFNKQHYYESCQSSECSLVRETHSSISHDNKLIPPSIKLLPNDDTSPPPIQLSVSNSNSSIKQSNSDDKADPTAPLHLLDNNNNNNNNDAVKQLEEQPVSNHVIIKSEDMDDGGEGMMIVTEFGCIRRSENRDLGLPPENVPLLTELFIDIILIKYLLCCQSLVLPKYNEESLLAVRVLEFIIRQLICGLKLPTPLWKDGSQIIEKNRRGKGKGLMDLLQRVEVCVREVCSVWKEC